MTKKLSELKKEIELCKKCDSDFLDDGYCVECGSNESYDTYVIKYDKLLSLARKWIKHLGANLNHTELTVEIIKHQEELEKEYGKNISLEMIEFLDWWIRKNILEEEK